MLEPPIYLSVESHKEPAARVAKSATASSRGEDPLKLREKSPDGGAGEGGRLVDTVERAPVHGIAVFASLIRHAALGGARRRRHVAAVALDEFVASGLA